MIISPESWPCEAWVAVYRTQHATAYKHTHVRVNATSGRCVNAPRPTRRIRTRGTLVPIGWYCIRRDATNVSCSPSRTAVATLIFDFVATGVACRYRDETATYTLFSFVLLLAYYAGTVLRPFSNVSRTLDESRKKIPELPDKRPSKNLSIEPSSSRPARGSVPPAPLSWWSSYDLCT